MASRTPHGGDSRLDARIERDRHLKVDGGPKRILSLDGGGVRGMITIGILEELERKLAARQPYPGDFRLCRYFDLIGGTSTGSIIAALLAMGWSVDEIRKLYLKLGPEVFERRQAFGVNRPKFSHTALESIISKITAGLTLESDQLKTGFAVFTKRVDTGSAWVLFNHPDSKYWRPKADEDFRPNKDYEIGALVRASAAAPYFFDAAEILVAPAKDGREADNGVFLDGAVGGANNPSVQLLTLATLKDYPFQWEVGADKLFVISIGTGTRRERRVPKALKQKTLFGNLKKAITALQGMIYDTGQTAITTMQALSVPPSRTGGTGRWRINGEIEDMPGAPIADPPLCTFLRLDASLEEEPMRAVIRKEYLSERGFQRGLASLALIDLGKPKHLARLLKIGRAAGVTLGESDLPPAFDIPRRAPEG
jgi:hypothetical protein